MEKLLKLILEKMDEGFQAIDRKFEAIDQRFEAIDRKFEAIDQRFEAIDRKFDAIDQRFEAIDRKFDAIDQRFETIERKLDTVESEQKRQGELLHQLVQTVAATNVKISETNERLDVLEMKVDKMSEDIKEIKQVMATKKDLEYYDQMISEHAREIYKLKNR